MNLEIRLDQVSFGYDGGSPLVTGFCGRFAAGEVIGVHGSSGSGKSTLIKLIATILRPVGGFVSVDGIDFWASDDAEKNIMRKNIGFDFQDAALISNMSVERNLQLPVEYSTGDKYAAAKFAADAIVRGGLSEYSMMLPAALSYGIRRRVSLLRAEICAKGAFFSDEPNQVSDGHYRKMFLDILKENREKKMLSVIASGDLEFLTSLVDRVVEIRP